MYDENLPKTHIVRNRETGLYWRGTKGSNRHKPRDPWTDKPEMAWLCHLPLKQVRWLFEGHFTKDTVPPYDVCQVELQVSSLPVWDKDHDQDAECLCGHTYGRHFDTYDGMRAVGCKYCHCGRFEPQDYAAEFRKAKARGEERCGKLNEGGWDRCSRPHGHPGQHVALDDGMNVATTWEWCGDGDEG